jgi:hypothetical protein
VQPIDDVAALLPGALREPAGFTHVLYLEVPGMKHAIPGAPDLNTALEFLEGTGAEAAASTRTP